MREKPDLPVEESPSTVRRAYIEACRQAQRQMVDVQSDFQRAMTEAHLSFIRAMETSLADLKAMAESDAEFDVPLEPPQVLGDEAQPVTEQPVAKQPVAEPPVTEPSIVEPSIVEPSIVEPETPLMPMSPELSFGRYALQTEPAAPVGLAMSGLASSRLVVTDEGTGIAEALVEQLQARGIQAEVVTEVPSDASGAILLGGLRAIGSVDETVAVNYEAFRAASKLAKRFTTGRGVFVVVQDTGGDFGLSGQGGDRAGLGGLAGLAKTARLEWPGVTVKAIDLERGGRPAWKIAKVLAEELFDGGPEIEVGLHADGGRVSLETFPALLNLGTPEGVFSVVDRGALRQNSVLVASGGARGITAAALIALARNARPRVVLLGRTVLEDEPEVLRALDGEDALRQGLRELGWSEGRALAAEEFEARFERLLASREVRSNLADLHQAGSEVRYHAVDIQDREAVEEALAEVRQEWGPITGLIHGVGARVDRPLVDKTEDDFNKVFRSKVNGLFNLLELMADDPLELLLLFSSATARTGHRGLSDYTMANEVLNKVAWAEHSKRGGRCLVKALNWSLWEGRSVATKSSAKGKTATTGETERPIPIDVGARMLVEEIQAGLGDQVEVILGAPPDVGPTQPDALALLTMDAFVSAATHPFLEGYGRGEAPVLPLPLVLEWFTRITRAHGGDLEIVACRDLKVLRSVKLENFYEGSDAFTVVSHQHQRDSGHELHLELYARDGSLRFTAVADMATPGTTVRASTDTARLLRDSQNNELRPWPFSSIYGHALSQGPECQVIREILGFSDEGLVAMLAGAHEMGWLEGWNTDVAALDGGLQLVVLWFQHRLGGTAMVTRVDSYHSHFSGLVEGPIRAVLRGHSDGYQRVICDVVFINENGTLVAELRGVEARAFIKPAILPEPEVSIEIEEEEEEEEALDDVEASDAEGTAEVDVDLGIAESPLEPNTAAQRTYSPGWLEKATRAAAMLEGLLSEADPRSALTLADPATGNLVRFVGGEGKIFLDLPGEAVGARHMPKAEVFFAALSVKKDTTEIYEDGELAESHETFGLDLEGDIERATQIALDIFFEVYELSDDFVLDIQHG